MVRTNLQEFVGDVHVLSNLQVGSNLFANDLAANVLTVDGSIGSTFFIGDGGLLSNIATTLNDIVANPGGNTVSNTLVFESGADVTSNTAIVTYANVGISVSNTNPTGEYQLSIGSNIFVNTHASNVLTIIGSVGANTFIGDGGLLSNIATTIDQIVDQGNTVSNTLQLISGMDATSNIGLVTHKDVGISISNTEPTGEFQFGVGSNLLVNVYSSNVLSIEGNVNAEKMTLGTISVTSAYGLNHVTAQGSATGDTISLTNATTGLEVTSNITAGGNVTAQTVITSANVEVGDRLKFASNVFVDDLRVADLAANLVTYDKTTGELMDSGGLFANKLAVVSVQPPSALTANTTTIAKHGTYTVSTTSLAANSNAWNAFDGAAVDWLASTTSDHLYNASGNDGVYGGTSNLFAGNYIQPGVSSAGEWLAIEFPYKTTLRHMKLTPPATYQQYPASANLYATNDSLTWTELTNWSDVNPGTQQSNVQTITVNATEAYKKYAMVVTKTNGSDTNTGLAKWDLFAESFSIDGGKISMAQQPTTGGETVMDQHGPHGRLPKAVPLKKYPEILFEEGKFDRNDSTNTYVQAGYTVSADSVYNDRQVYRLFEGADEPADGFTYSSEDASENGFVPASGLPVSGVTFQDQNGTSYTGHYIKLELPKKIKLNSVYLSSRNQENNLAAPNDKRPTSGTFLGSNDGTNWTLLKTFNDGELTWSSTNIANQTNATFHTTNITNIVNDGYFSYIMFLIEKIKTNNAYGVAEVTELEYYGYEEDPPLGDTSVDTTFTSIMNTPQTTGANVYVDAKLSSDFTNRVVGPTVSNTHTTYVSAEKYWELSGNVESNVTLEANTFLSGDAPHSVSVWFNSSNLEANTANTCVFSVSDQEKLDSVNLDLQSNTWHNLTYAYQGEGGSRVTYLDGRKVAEDQAEDTFGDYPPFAMTGHAQGGYVVSASSEPNPSGYEVNWEPWDAFDGTVGGVSGHISGSNYTTANPGTYNGTDANALLGTRADTGADIVEGDWLKIEIPHKLVTNYLQIYASTDEPDTFKLYGSNDDIVWTELLSVTGNTTLNTYLNYPTTTKGAFKYFAFVASKNGSTAAYWRLDHMKLYGHRENDLVRLPDPTNVLKYPHIAMTGPAQRGYVVEASHQYATSGDDGAAYNVFNTKENTWWGGYEAGNAARYTSPNFTYTGGGDSVSLGDTGISGEYIVLKLPYKITLSSLKLIVDDNINYAILHYTIVGSNNGTNWFTIKDVSGLTTSDYTASDPHTTTTDIVSSTAYSQIGLIVRQTSAAGQTAIEQIQYFGTEENSSIPIQIGGGNIDKVANFRVYDKFIGEDQALEIWDAQKDEFGRAKSSMTLHKGRLGIGTTEPEGRLAVLDEPHNLEEFPPSPMSDYKTYFEGHGEFCASSGTLSSGGAYLAFNKTLFERGWHGGAVTDAYYTNSIYQGSFEHGGYSGDWIRLDLPYKVKLSGSILYNRDQTTTFNRMPKKGVILGSNDNGVSWELVHSWDNETYEFFKEKQFTINSDSYFKSFILVIQELQSISTNDIVNLGEWRLFGTREQGQSVLHDGQLTLTKNLTVPRIGPALGEYPTPRRANLKVEFDTSLAIHSGKPMNTSNYDRVAEYANGAFYSVGDKAFEFAAPTNSSCDIVYVQHTLVGSTPTHTHSLWVKRKGYGYSSADYQWVAVIGSQSGSGTMSGVLFQANSNRISFDINNTRILSKKVIALNRWYHVVCTFSGGTSVWNTKNCKIYIDGVDDTDLDSTDGTIAFALSGQWVHLGANDAHTRGMTGSISNYKLYDVALTPDEVYTLYKQGKDQQTQHLQLVNTTMTIGPQNRNIDAMLDVAGRIRVGASTVLSFTGQHICSADEPMEKGLIVSAKKNRFVKLNGFATGREAITVDESLPIVSLSNVAQDKACFGVVSSIEKPSSKRKQEIGGVISETNKERGDNRAIVNSVGEGAIWVVDTGGSLESGDYITTSNVAGYGQKQNDDVLHNYTVAKITMDCDFTGSNVAVQTIKREETGLRTIMEDTWNQLVDYDRSSNTETQYSNTLAPSAYSDQPGYVPRKVTTIVDYTDGSNIVSIAEWSNLESNIQNTYQSNTFTEIVDYTKFVSVSEWSNLTTDVQNTYSEAEITTYYQIQRGGNVLDENGQLQFEDKTGATEAPYERRFLDVSGAQTDSANAVHIAAFVGCTYHCG